MRRFHLDTDFLVLGVSTTGPERSRLHEIADSAAELEMSSIAWYEFCRGPRTPEQIAVARALFEDDGIVALGEELAAGAAEVFRRLGSPRRRAADVAVGVTAVWRNATLLTGNARDFAGIPDLEVEVPAGRAPRSR